MAVVLHVYGRADACGQDCGRRTKASYARTGVQVLDIPADGGTGQEIFTYIPSGLNRNSFSQQLVGAVGRFYGTALRRVLGCLVDGLAKHVPDVKQMSTEFVQDVCPEAASGQVKRACQRLGLIAATREKAIDFGVLLWPEKTPRVRPSLVFSLGSRSAEDVDMEIENTLDRIKTFFQKHAETRFCKLF